MLLKTLEGLMAKSNPNPSNLTTSDVRRISFRKGTMLRQTLKKSLWRRLMVSRR